jgi:alkylhydroperoxidase/carboxymuconolactone decarboxylase family protein YurZ
MKADKGMIAATTGAAVVATADPGSGPTAQATSDGPPPEVLTILSEEQLAALKQGYDLATFHKFAPFQIRYDKAQPWIALVGNTIYNRETDERGQPVWDPNAPHSTLMAGQREIAVLSVMATTQRDPAAMAGHIYWALMEGMTVENIADVFLTVGTYAGLDNLRFTIGVLGEVLSLLANLTPGTKEMTTGFVLKFIVGAYARRVVVSARAAVHPAPQAGAPGGNS